ncbi:DUF1906 domain-containing protein [Acuticoccus sp. MNP-M23]|uniref:glycoside hydrolase domain-containing protein n=1 Tax=Acuticoccus sp. MNP-M23 TaxID=3072793 RepID=UPI00281665BA|nr:glycoside hydrolase domain-containing protein [Acuticoccus sp. MNP-M23]WMS44052.1 DUF1906 domain-containing protein [Acuticoccus sp. MNP-M23]
MRIAPVVAAFLAAVLPHAALADSRPAIIDAAWDTRPYVKALAASGVEVVGRYLARCPQPERGIPEKRLMDQGLINDPRSEVRQIIDNGMAVLSIYQFNNDSKQKFFGKDRNGKPLPDGSCRATSRPRTPAQEGALDAKAAVAQARALGQPRGSAIYFGVDIAFSAGDAPTRKAMLEYMTEVRRILRGARYKLGAYGNGDALDVLQNARLIDHSWLSASRAYPGTTAFHNSSRWDLFQHGVNLEWFTGTPGACRRGLPLDTNIKNARFANKPLGAWTRRGIVRIKASRTREVYAAHRFACDGDARIRKSANSGPRDLISSQSRCRGGRTVRHSDTVDYANAARIGRQAGDLVEVDYDHDGTFDGWTARSNLSPDFGSKPAWISSRAARRGARCR